MQMPASTALIPCAPDYAYDTPPLTAPCKCQASTSKTRPCAEYRFWFTAVDIGGGIEALWLSEPRIVVGKLHV